MNDWIDSVRSEGCRSMCEPIKSTIFNHISLFIIQTNWEKWIVLDVVITVKDMSTPQVSGGKTLEMQFARIVLKFGNVMSNAPNVIDG